MPQAAPAANPAQPNQGPPLGNAAVSQPTANRGYEAAGLQRLGLVVQQLQEVLPLVGAGSDVGQVILDALKKISKFVPPGSVTPASQNQMISGMQQRAAQNNQQLQAIMQQRQQQAPGGQPQGQPQPKAA